MSEESRLSKAISSIGAMALPRVALFAIILTAAYFFLFYDSGATIVASIETAKSQLALENNKKIETQKVLKKEQAMKADVELVVKKFEEIKAKIPIEFTESELRSLLDKYSTQNYLKTIKSERRSYSAPAGDDENEKLIEQVSLSYEFLGNYASISRFVMELLSLEKVIKVADFSISKHVNNKSGKSKEQILLFKATIIGYKQSLQAMQKVSP